MQLINKRIVITGGTSGIGYEMVKQLAADNEVVIIAKDRNKLDSVKQVIQGVVTYQADLSQLPEVESVADAIVRRYESIDVFVNNAAIQFTPMFLDDDFRYETIPYEVTLNFTSICSLTYLLLPALLHQHKATILNVNSGLGLTPKASSAVYCATKGALNIFSQSLRYQLAQTNIHVQQAFLDLVDTPMTQGRGQNKMSAQTAALAIIRGIESDISDHDIGKVRYLRWLLRLLPSVAQRIMKKY